MLQTVNPKAACPACGGKSGKRNPCDACQSSGFAPIDVSGAWSGARAGFLVCGGPSLKLVDIRQLGRRGVVSLGVNNCAAAVPVRAWTFSDPQYKFHHSLFLDPSVLTFAPTPKLKRCVRAQKKDGKWVFVKKRVGDCPSTIGYSRSAAFCPETFLTSEFAQWGMGGHQHKKGGPYLAMMPACPDCEGGACSKCDGKGCKACHPYKGKPTGKCAKCTGLGKVRPFTRQATMLIGLRLLCHLGLKRIYLIGVDFSRPSKEEGYGFDEAGSGGTGVYEKENRMLCMVKPYLDQAGIEVLNTSPVSSCTAFPKCSFDEAIEDCTRYTRNIKTRGWYAKEGVQDWKNVPEGKYLDLEGLEL